MHLFLRRVLTLLCLAADSMVALAVPREAACSAQSSTNVPVVVELYTSEGCSSCPPAENWLSGLAGREDIIALAFHVDYWDGFGWKDRFAQAQFTKRQNASLGNVGARFAYTPEVIVNGRDMPGWGALSATALRASMPATVNLALARDAAAITLTVTPGVGAPRRLSGYVAVVDDGMQTHVAGGENRGATLRQDDVVRELFPWDLLGPQPATLRFISSSTPEPDTTRHWVAVVTKGPYGKPLQAISLACPS